MLLEQHGEQGLRGNETAEATVFINDRDAGFTVLNRFPGDVLLMRVRGDRRRIGIHHVPDDGTGSGAQQTLDGHEADQ